MPLVHAYYPEQLSDRQRLALVDLFLHTWPMADASNEEVMARFNPSAQQETDTEIRLIRFIIWDDEVAVAHTGIFEREVHTAHGTLHVGALSGVCTRREYQGRGYGAATVRAAFELVEQGVYPVSLWMTTVPGFYEKLGARIVQNTWVNHQNPDTPTADPWPDEVKMIYPALYTWPEGPIDLNGPAY